MATVGRGTAWRQRGWRALRRLFCCACGRLTERRCSSETRDAEDGEGVRMRAEDLGTVNPGFVPVEDGALAKGRTAAATGRSASLAWSCRQAWQKRKLASLSSLPLQSGPTGRGAADTPPLVMEEKEEEEEEEEAEGGPDNALLTLPLINLIPPTPSDVVDDDQFFDINSEEDSLAHTSGSECVDSVSSQALGDQDSVSEEGDKAWDGGAKRERRPEGQLGDEEEGPMKGHPGIPSDPDQIEELAKEFAKQLTEEQAKEHAMGQAKELAKEPAKEQAKEQAKTQVNESAKLQAKEQAKGQAKESPNEPAKLGFLRSSFQVLPLPEYPRKRSFNAGINLLQFTEHNLDDLGNKDVNNHELLRAKLRLLPLDAKMDLRKPATRTCSLGDHVTRSHTFHSVPRGSEEMPEEEGSPRQRRITVASYIPQTKHRKGNFVAKQHCGGDGARTLAELDTEGVCGWFVSIGLQKCLPFIRGAGLCGSHIASIDPDTLEVLHVPSLEERELLLSAIYRELHPPDTTTQKLDILLESIGPHDVDKFTAELVSMCKSKSSPHVNCLTSAHSSFQIREKSRHPSIQRRSHLVEISINALEQIVHLRTPKDTTVGKLMESCLKTLGVTDNKEVFSLRNKEDPLTDLPFDQQIGDLLGSEKKPLELHLCKKGNLRTKEEKIRELNQHVDSLQNVIHQVQELHQGLVSFCEELKKTESERAPDPASPSDAEAQLGLAQSRLREKQRSVRAIQDSLSGLDMRKDRRPEVHLLDKMKLDCQIFKEEISIIHLNRHVARLKSGLQDFQAKDRGKGRSSALGQLVSPQSPAVLLMTQETRNSEGRYGFTARFAKDAGLLVVNAENTQLCLNDRLVEVNGVSVLDSGEDELCDLLSRRPSAQIVVLRKPPPRPPKPGRAPEPVHTRPLGDHPPAAPPPLCQVIAT